MLKSVEKQRLFQNTVDRNDRIRVSVGNTKREFIRAFIFISTRKTSQRRVFAAPSLKARADKFSVILV